MELIMDQSIPPALPDQPASNDAWASFYMESVAERMKRRRKPRENVVLGSNAPASKRQKVEQTINAKTIQPAQMNYPEKMLTPPLSDNGIASIEEPYIRDTASDIDFTNDTLQALQQRLATYRQCVGRRQTERIVQLLQIAIPATQEQGPVLDEEGVKPYLAPGYYHDGPLFLKDQQPLPTVSVSQLCSEFYDDTAKVWIQDPAANEAKIATREVEIGEVKARLRSGLNENPWNCLEMASPYEDGLRPKFLNSEDCRLLTKIKIPDPEPGFKGAKVGRRFLRHGYKEAEKWVLLAQSGALTEPHQDSHGYSTYITVNEGIMGFGWLHKPTELQRQRWIKNPQKFIEGEWRYRVLRSGDTVYFPAGTVHFVYRHPNAGHTLAFGGHVLRCSTIVQWINTIRQESINPEVTNEELTTAAFGYLRQVGSFVEQALMSEEPEQIARWGGRDSIQTFLTLKEKLLSRETAGKGSKKTKGGV